MREKAKHIIGREFTTLPYRVYKRTTWLHGMSEQSYVYFQRVVAKEEISRLIPWSGNDYKEAVEALKKINESIWAERLKRFDAANLKEKASL